MRTQVRGMTLIELLIVFSIVGMLVALVAPATSGLMDKARAQEVSVTGRGTEIFWTVEDSPPSSLKLSRLFVEPEQTIKINANGVATPDRLSIRQAGRERVLILNRWMARG